MIDRFEAFIMHMTLLKEYSFINKTRDELATPTFSDFSLFK